MHSNGKFDEFIDFFSENKLIFLIYMFKIVNYSQKYANFVIFLYKMIIFDQTLTQ